MLALVETSAGFALFRVTDEAKLRGVDEKLETLEGLRGVVKLAAFKRFDDVEEAVLATKDLVQGRLGKPLKKFLKENIVSKGLTEQLAVSDAALGLRIKDKLDIPVVGGTDLSSLMRGLRGQATALLPEVDEAAMKEMQLGLAHALSRYKLQFSADKVDTMIVQAISLLDDLDKEVNTYSMRVREWYGWHMPELTKLITDNNAFAKTVKKVGMRTNFKSTDLEGILDEDVVHSVRDAAEISMGTEVSDEDMTHIQSLCDQIIAMSNYRAQLFDYLRNRMNAIAPNLTLLVGELVGARLIAHAGSLMNLAKYPASTIQILGAEKALFRALKTKHATPKYGLVYHASLVGQASAKNKGKISRLLSAKCALSTRVDALGEADGPTIGLEHRVTVEDRLAQLEGGRATRISGTGKEHAREARLQQEPVAYRSEGDFVGLKRHAEAALEEVADEKKEKKKKKAKEEEAAESPVKKRKKDK